LKAEAGTVHPSGGERRLKQSKLWLSWGKALRVFEITRPLTLTVLLLLLSLNWKCFHKIIRISMVF